ncbi:MAG: hypothetical protein CVV21_07955 [Candidatus Goldiibacteriota bacterium HGW-Goldbacteria-1]|jgi:hypothetical protein|nr:MAG: hypothetical protein CVV21_07955 [Candidatus Goldiibacteriota bacterium HGW-Goldbacteria-1]
MKKYFLVVLLSIFSVSAAIAGFYDGGPGRTAAMGGQEAVLPDISNTFDLYSIGFSSAILIRPAKNIINIYPDIAIPFGKSIEDDASETTNERSGFTIGTGVYKSSNNGLVLWLSDSSVLTVKPYLSATVSNRKVSSTTSDTHTYTYTQGLIAGEAEYAFKLSDTLGVAGLVGYYRNGLKSERNDEDDYNNVYFDKMIYQVSALLMPDSKNGGWAFAASAGNKTEPLAPRVFNLDMNLEMAEFEYLMHPLSFISIHQYEYEENLIQEHESFTDYEGSGFLVETGTSYNGKGNMAFMSKVGLIAGYTFKISEKDIYKILATNITTETSDSFTPITGGMGFNFAAASRWDLGLLIPGVKLEYRIVGYDIKNSGGDTLSKNSLSFTKAAAGTSFRLSESLLIPFEIFYDNLLSYAKDPNGTGENFSYFIDYGGKLGVEIGLEKTTFLRFGIDCTIFGDHSISKLDGEITGESHPMGSEENRNAVIVGLNTGLGMAINGIQANIGLRFENLGFSPENKDYRERSDLTLKILSDIKMFF